MQLRQSSRTQAKIKLALPGPAGAGKTFSALLLAYGITNNWGNTASKPQQPTNPQHLIIMEHYPQSCPWQSVFHQSSQQQSK